MAINDTPAQDVLNRRVTQNSLKPVLRGENLIVVRQNRKILDIDEISVLPGEILAVVGPNGAGKSTLLTLLACLEIPKQGKIYFHGRQVTRKNALQIRRQMAVVFQEPLLLDGTVKENVNLGLALRGQKHQVDTKIESWLRRFGILHLADQMAHTLSGGEAQRTALARALVLEPEVLFLDEPFASLDSLTKQNLIRQFKNILEESGTTTVLVTHDFSEVQALATRVLVLSEGRIQLEGTPDEILQHPVWQKLAGKPLSAAKHGSKPFPEYL